MVNVEVMRIKAVDMDLIYTENWLAVFKIIAGNEAGYFSITTDSKTNEGVIMIHKVSKWWTTPFHSRKRHVIQLMAHVLGI